MGGEKVGGWVGGTDLVFVPLGPDNHAGEGVARGLLRLWVGGWVGRWVGE